MGSRLMRVDDDFYRSLKKIQRDIFNEKGIEISLSDATKIMMRGKRKRTKEFDFSFT